MNMGASSTTRAAAAATNAAPGSVGPAKDLLAGIGLIPLLAFGTMNVFLS